MSTPLDKSRRKPPLRLAEGGAPPVELEEALERRLDELFIRAVEVQSGEPLTDSEREALLRRIKYRAEAKALDREGEPGGKVIQVVPPTLYSDLGDCGVLGKGETRELAVELEATIPSRTHGYAESVPPLVPTSAAPGSEEKIRVMRQRLRKGQDLHHPDDAKVIGRLFAAGLLTPGAPHEEDDEA